MLLHSFIFCLKLSSYVDWDNIVSEDGFVNLFNGLDLQGWSMAGRGKFRVIEQERALESEDGMGLLWYTNRMYGDFILKIDWRVKRRSDNSGVFIRFSDPGVDPWNAVKTGYEIQIDDLALPDGRAEHKTGAIYDIVPPATLASKQVGEWNTFEIHAMGRNYTVILNEVTVIPKFSGTRLRRGYIGIQNHDAGSHVLFRNIRIKNLSE
jgi:3-keto-disaccharide hydrolase